MKADPTVTGGYANLALARSFASPIGVYLYLAGCSLSSRLASSLSKVMAALSNESA